MRIKKELTIKRPQLMTPADTIYAAVNKNTDLKLLKEAMELQDTWERRQAEKAYNKSIASFKANPPEIVKDQEVKFDTARGGKVGYRYANLANVIEKVTPELSRHGLTISWRTFVNDKINVTCRISHELGHYEETTLCADSEGSGTKNAIQAMGSAITYMQRYTALALLGLACADGDDDGRSTSIQPAQNQAQEAQVVKPKLTLSEMVKEEAKKKFKDPDAFKLWRIEKNLVENLTTATDFELAKLLNYLKSK